MEETAVAIIPVRCDVKVNSGKGCKYGDKWALSGAVQEPDPTERGDWLHLEAEIEEP